jgi:hypothetical protein
MKYFQFVFYSLFLLTPGMLVAQEDTLDQQAFSFFSEETPLKMELTFDVKEFLKTKRKAEYLPANLKVVMEDGEVISSPIEMRARGNFRRDYCQLPPVKLNFEKAEIDHPELQELEKVKLVTSCRFQTTYQQYLFKEYLIYQAFGLLTDKSFRVRLIDLTYVDSRGKKKPFTQFGFLIEEIDRLADRHDCIEFEAEGVSGRVTNTEQMALISVFQYMIGNTDWAVQELHNVKMIRPDNPAVVEAYVIPYDFDYCGLVDASYAIPHEDLGIESVRERLFRGYCYTPDTYEVVFAKFIAQKAALYQLFEDFPYLMERERKESIAYLDEFYYLLETPGLAEKRMLVNCIK